MSFGTNSTSFFPPALLAALVMSQACATAEDIDAATQQAIATGILVPQATTTTPAQTSVPTAPVTPQVPTTTAVPTQPATQPAPSMEMPAEPTQTPEAPTVQPTPTPSAGAGGTPPAPEPPAPATGGMGGMGGSASGSGGSGGAPLGDAGGAGGGAAEPQPGIPQELIDLTDMEVYYQASDSGGTIVFKFAIVNNTLQNSPLMNEISARYWYTSDGQDYMATIDSAGTAVATAADAYGTTADGREYVEFTFTGTMAWPLTTANNVNRNEIQIRISPDFSSAEQYDQTNDYSFDATHQWGQPYDRITVYRRGALVWGEEPME